MEDVTKRQQNENMNKMFDKGTEFMRKELQEEQPCGCNCLPNELLINIFEYLPHTDLQKVREVCNRWHHITSLHEFMGKSKFIINAKNVATISKCLHSDEEFPTRMKYDTVEIKGLEASNDLCLILNALYQNVRKVDLYDSPVFSLLNTSTPQLEELVVFQSSDRAHTNLTVEMNFTRFKNFKSLDMSDLVTPDIHKSLLLKLADDRSLKMENLSLVVFGGQEQLIIDTLRHHCQSLKHLTIRLSCYLKEQTQWYQLFASFRQLESLKIHGWYNKHWIKEIMECLPGDINLRHIDVLCRSEDDLLLEQIIKKWPQSLENINLVGWDNITNDGVAGFSKLQLKNFKMSCCKYISLQGLLEGVAKERNTTLKTLILIDMGSRDRECMMLLTQRLPNLTYLSLMDCTKSKFIINAKNVATISKCLHSDEEFPTRMKYDTVEIKGLEASNDLCLILNALCQNVRKVDLYDSPVFSLLNTSTPQLEELVVFQSSDRAHTNLTVEMNLTRFKNFKSLDISDLVTPDIHKSLLLKLADDRSLKMENLSLVVFGGHEQLIINTLRYHSQYLKHLKIRLKCYLKEQTQWYQLFASFRQLESLKIHGWYNKHWIKEIMECLPGDINLRHIDVLCRSEDDLLLEQIIKKWPQSLENINLVGWDNITNDGVAGFSKLQLKNFKMSCCKYISLQGLLEGVAKERNTTLKTLILIDMGSRDRECMMLLTQSLPNLTYLSLANCRKSVDNYTLASIFDNMPNLQHLILEKCHRIRNKGLLGFGSNPAPISKLKGLQTLNLSGCRRLTNFGKGLKLNELRKLNLSFCRNITSRDIRELVRNCPALEDLVVCGCSVISDYDVLHIAQGLRRLKRLDLGYCIKLTPKSIDYLMEFGFEIRWEEKR